MSGEQAIFYLQIKKKSGLSLNPDIHHSKVFSSDILNLIQYILDILNLIQYILDILNLIQYILDILNLIQ